jgi:hypothetical protein
LVTVIDGIDTSTKMGELLLVVLAAVAQIESINISERAERGIASKRSRGCIHMPRIPLGFEVVETKPAGARVLAPSSTPKLYGDQQRRRFKRMVAKWQSTAPWILPPLRKAKDN